MGSIFGLFSWLDAETPLLKDPVVAILPRLVIGVVAWIMYTALRRRSVFAAAAAAGFLGSLTNTVGVLGLGVLRGYLPSAAIPPTIPQVIVEAIIAAIITVVVAKGVLPYRGGRTAASEIAPGSDRRY